MTDTEIRLGRNFLRSGDPCRVRGKRGLWRFVRVESDDRADRAPTLELVGPSDNPRTRFFSADIVRRVQPTEAARAKVGPR